MAEPGDPLPPEEPATPVDTCGQLLTNALVDSGVLGIDEAPEQAQINRALTQVNWLLAQWARKRWLVYRIQDYSFVSSAELSSRSESDRRHKSAAGPARVCVPALLESVQPRQLDARHSDRDRPIARGLRAYSGEGCRHAALAHLL